MKIAKRVAALLAFIAVVAGLGWTPVDAHKGHDHLVMGTLTMVAPDHVMVKVTDPKTKQDSVKTIAIKSTTKLLKGVPGTPARTVDLMVGLRVVVNVGEGKEPLSAKQINIASAPAPGTK